MPAPVRNQSDAPSIGLIPDRYPLIVVLQGVYQLLASSNRYIYRYNYEYFKHICHFLTQISLSVIHGQLMKQALVYGSKQSIYHTLYGASTRQEPVRRSQHRTDSRLVPAHCGAGRLPVTGPKILIYIDILVNSSYIFLSFYTQVSLCVIYGNS